MNTRMKRLFLSLLLAVGVGGCAVYGPPYGTYDPYYYNYGPPVYVGPPVSLDLGFGFYERGHGGRGYHHRGHHYGGYRHWGHGRH
jgi:hypothetical protein